MQKVHYKIDPWKIIENDFDSSKVKASESIFSLEMDTWAIEQISRSITQEQLSKAVILGVFIIQIKPKWVGGKTDILNILQKF